MKKVCFVTAARSEYGILKWLMRDVMQSSKFQFQLIVTGGHLLQEQGYTINQIIEDGFSIDEKIDCMLDTSTEATIAAAMGRMAEKFANVFQRLKPDMLVVLGDRYELLAICSTAFIMGIPIAHISGGDVTEGAIDDGVRNAVTMLATYHFPGTQDSANNIARMRNSDVNIWTVGEPGLDAFNRELLMDRTALAENLGLDMDKKWVLMTYHSETTKTLEYNLDAVEKSLSLLKDLDGYQIVATYSNADFGGRYINELLEKTSKEYQEQFKVIPSLGNLRYLSFMKQVEFVIGNSSSGIVEAPALSIPVVNIGDRQKGRYQCRNIIQCGTSKEDIECAIRKAIEMDRSQISDAGYWGDGNTAERIVRILEEV